MKNIHLCTSWLKWCYIYLKLLLKFSSTWRIFTSVRVFYKYFYGRKSTSMRVDYNGISTLETLPQEYIPLCECFSIFHWRISIFVWVENNIYLKNIHLCTSVFQFLLLKNTFVWVDSNGIAFTWICFLPEEYTPLYKSTKTVFSTLEKKIIQIIYTSVWVDKNDIFYT